MSTCSENHSSESNSEPVSSDADSDAANNQAVQSFLNLTNYSELDMSARSDQVIDCDFTRINLEEWRTAVSPTSSLSSIHSSDEDCLEAAYNLEDYHHHESPPMASSSCDSSQSITSRQQLYQHSYSYSSSESVSIEEINARIGIAEELDCVTPTGNRRIRMATKLETIFEGQFLHTPPPQRNQRPGSEMYERASKSWSCTTSSSSSFADRLERL